MSMTATHVLFIYFTGTLLLAVGLAWYAWANWAHHPRRRRRHA